MPTLAELRARLPMLDGLDDESAIQAIQQAYYPTVPVEAIAQRLGYTPPKVEKPLPERSMLAAVNDTVIEAGNAVAGGVSAIANFVSPGNRVSSFINENIIEPGKASQSDRRKAIDARLSEDLAAAEGVGAEIAAIGRYAAADIPGLLGQAVGSFAIPGAAVKAGGMIARGLGMAGSAAGAGMAGGAIAGGALSGGDAAGQAYEDSLKAGASEEQAQAAARQASAIPAVVGAAGGMLGAERLLAGGKGFAGGAATRALKAGLSEGAQEALEEGVTQYEANRAVAPFDGRDPMKGVAAAATLGALTGGPVGGGVALLTPREQDAPTLGDTLTKIADAKTADDAIKAAAEGLDLPGMSADREAAALAGIERQGNEDAKSLKRFGAAPAEQAAQALPPASVTILPGLEVTEIQPDQTIVMPSVAGRGMSPKDIALQGIDQIAAEQDAILRRFPLPTGEATEIVPAGDATEIEPVPVGVATEIVPEVIDGDLLTNDNVPYGSRAGALVRAKREGLTAGNVVEIPGAGWVVRPVIEARPAGTRGTNAADVLPKTETAGDIADVPRTAAEPAASGDGRTPSVVGGVDAVGRVAADTGGGEPNAAPATVAGGAEVAPAGDGDGRGDALRARAIDAFKRVSAAKYPGRSTARTAEMAVERLLPAIEAKNADALLGMNLGSADMNPASRAVFEAVTGVKLPKGRAASERAIDEWAGITPQEREARLAAKRQAEDASAAQRELEFARRMAQRITVKNGDRTVDGASWVDELRGNGFTNVVRRGPKTYLANADGAGWAMPHKDIAEYARKAAVTPPANEGQPQQGASNGQVQGQGRQEVAAPVARVADAAPAPTATKLQARQERKARAERDDKTIELRKRLSVLRSLKECVG